MHHKTDQPNKLVSRHLLWFSIITILALRLLVIHTNGWGLHFDEAQYWVWSHHLAWGYYSKPPMIAWAIKLQTYLWGDSIFALRALSVVIHGFTSLVIYQTGNILFNRQVASYHYYVFKLINFRGYS